MRLALLTGSKILVALCAAYVLNCLIIAKSGPAYAFYSSSDGKRWQVLRVFSLGEGLRPRVGFESQSPVGDGTEVIFSAIHYSPKKITDIYKSDTF
jgi:hypothetical protein